MKTGIAQIEVQQSFCNRCAIKIKEALLKIEDITNVYLYPKDSLIVFNFVKANEISKALNLLTELGYPEIREKGNCNNRPFCDCTVYPSLIPIKARS